MALDMPLQLVKYGATYVYAYKGKCDLHPSHESGAAFAFTSPPPCLPGSNLTSQQCTVRNASCNGSKLKWVTSGCTSKSGSPLNDGGCQCHGYCAYKCQAACNSDGECTWNKKKKKCFVKAKKRVGAPISSC